MNNRGSQTLGLHFSLICLAQKYIIYQAGIFNSLTIDYFRIISKQLVTEGSNQAFQNAAVVW